MISLLHIISFAAAVAAFLFVTLSLASGLLWIAEVIEEHSRLAKTVGRRSIYAIIGLHLLLLAVDRFPLWATLFSIGCHVVYLQNFSKTWPLISLTSPSFIASCILVLSDHFVWFWHFSSLAEQARASGRRSPYSRPAHDQAARADAPAFMDVAAFFGICVWFIPLYLFLSLSANDNALPSFGSTSNPPPESSSSGPPPARHSLFMTFLSSVSSILPRFLTRGSASRGAYAEGLIAPQTPGSVPVLASGTYSPWGAPEQPTTSPVGYRRSPSPFGNGGIGGVAGGPSYGGGLSAIGFQNEINKLRPSRLAPPPSPRRTVSENVITTGGLASSASAPSPLGAGMRPPMRAPSPGMNRRVSIESSGGYTSENEGSGVASGRTRGSDATSLGRRTKLAAKDD